MKISVVIPTLNEEFHIEKTLQSVTRQEGDYEIYVVDGGSADNTVAIAKRYACVINSKRGRAVQMNAGAKLCMGDILLFLHADTLLPDNAFREIRKRMQDDTVVGGSFYIAFDADNFILRGVSFITRFNFRLFHFGDQGIFVRRDVFRKLRGYKEMPIMEDYDFYKRLREEGKVILIRMPVISSARRFIRKGVLRQLLINKFVVLAYWAGLDIQTIKRFYDDMR
ncbi:MAG: TIGR04283 family arsenosugar biosynthesis glycosyltransferase [Planctomycetes bacterium]|uniref:TIGR04283 family arsenosugar biosynthesis glycosyltransferase n=1 Tax=Candidatus Wunengus sp. YC65 TaxID=3367701 RepID=UPI001D66B93F|nr:TIGR04283 family arsenosugar biosynthesis glycosyltransferase [Planctomycetota bacterium]